MLPVYCISSLSVPAPSIRMKAPHNSKSFIYCFIASKQWLAIEDADSRQFSLIQYILSVLWGLSLWPEWSSKNAFPFICYSIRCPTQPFYCCCSVAQTCLTLLRPHGLQHARPPCPSPSPRVCSNSCPLSQWCYLIISSSAAPFSFAFSLSLHQGLF